MRRSNKELVFRIFKTLLVTALPLAMLLEGSAVDAQTIRRNFRIRGAHELSGGIGFAADLSSLTPGGFKWFNEYGYHARGPAWLNVQLNVTTGDSGGGCVWHRDVLVCDDRQHFHGTALELGVGVKLKWRAARAPVQFHAKFGGALDFIWFDLYYGTAFTFRSGAGVRYFFVPNFSIGGELVAAFGPAFPRFDNGPGIYGALDFNFGVEWRF